MNTILFSIFLLLSSSFTNGDTLASSNQLTVSSDQDSATLLEDTVEYVPFSVSISGKLKMKGLPLSPSLKIFMLEDSLIDISARAPFVGEAMRIVITPDTILAVNKMKKTYLAQSLSQFQKYYPGDISDIQSLLLARFFLPGINLDEINPAEVVDIFYEDDQYNVIPKGDAKIPGITYGFVVNEEFDPLMLVVLPEERPDIEIDAQYSYYPKGYDILLSYIEGSRLMECTLELKDPEYDVEMPKPLEISSKYRPVSLPELIKF